jgi:hypothetical protein
LIVRRAATLRAAVAVYEAEPVLPDTPPLALSRAYTLLDRDSPRHPGAGVRTIGPVRRARSSFYPLIPRDDSPKTALEPPGENQSR